jgi:diaminopimelate decarboxylase
LSFDYLHDELCCDGVPVTEIAAEVGTPFYIYSLDEVTRRYRAYTLAFPGALVAYAYKANPCLALVAHLARLGAGADVVSGGELYRALRAGVPPERIIFNGNGKTDPEIDAALAAGICVLNVDSAGELVRVAELARRQDRTAPVAVRVNPDIDPHTHPHVATGLRTSKFGVPISQAPALYVEVVRTPGLRPVGIHCHLGSQIVEVEPLRQAAERIAGLVHDLHARGIELEHVNLGGGLGINYGGPDALPGQVPRLAALAAALGPVVADLGLPLILEPGRSIVGPAGALVGQVLAVKQGLERTFVVLDVGMNALIRPALYAAFHRIWPVQAAPPAMTADVVGPICESADVLGRDRALPRLRPGDLLAVLDAGAYAASMATTYNGQPRPAEVIVSGGCWWLVRRRERWEDLLAGEEIPEKMTNDE